MQVLLTLHDWVRWLILIFAFWTVISAISGLSGRRRYSSSDNKSNLFFMISMDIQIVLGMILYFNGPWFDVLKNIGSHMKDSYYRFFGMEHFLMMLIAWILVHAGRTSVKKAITDRAKFKKQLIYFGIALIVILAAIPWPFREAVARPWIRFF